MYSMTRSAVFLFACSLTVSGTTWASMIWVEMGDAGYHFNPRLTKGVGNLRQITGTIGEPDLVDAFLFRYGGASGLLNITATFDPPAPPSLFLLVALFDESGASVASGEGALTVNDLSAGLYAVEIVAAHGDDPPFTIELSGPTTGPQGVLFAESVPEPSTLALSGSGVIILAACPSRPRPVCRHGRRAA